MHFFPSLICALRSSWCSSVVVAFNGCFFHEFVGIWLCLFCCCRISFLCCCSFSGCGSSAEEWGQLPWNLGGRSFPPPGFVEGGEENENIMLIVNKHPVELTHVLFHNSFQRRDKILSWEERNWLWTVWLLPQAVVGCQEPHRIHLPLFGTLRWCSEKT